MDVVQLPAEEGFHLDTLPLAAKARLGFGDASGTAQRLHQSLELTGGGRITTA